ncbi:TPA: endonuclease III [Candidatus Avigastranaerophilus faecigallinarum]|nr:endonuclease III [Candidatus Avigastranaerophilus faecigallinarum]
MIRNFKEIIKRIKEMNLPYTQFVQFMEDIHDPFIVLIACILSLRTNDRTTYPATMRMLELGKTPKDFLKVKLEDLEKAIYPVGFYKNKAKQILDIASELYYNYNSIVPKDIDELTKFKGVGRKTANLVQSKGYNLPSICVDVHVHRISNRLGIVSTNEPEETEFALKENLPKELWSDINTLFVTLGQNVCKPTKPNCDVCKLQKYCNFYKSK